MVNVQDDTMSLVGPNNAERTAGAEGTQVERLIGERCVRERVDITYEEAPAISVQPME